VKGGWGKDQGVVFKPLLIPADGGVFGPQGKKRVEFSFDRRGKIRRRSERGEGKPIKGLVSGYGEKGPVHLLSTLFIIRETKKHKGEEKKRYTGIQGLTGPRSNLRRKKSNQDAATATKKGVCHKKRNCI